MPKLKTSLSLVGNYMCKNPPIVLFNITNAQNEKQSIKKYLFNTPPDIQRNLQSQFVTINGSQTVMFTNFSHQTISGMVNLVMTLHDYQKMRRVMKMKIYGTEKHWDYFQSAKFHLSQKSFGISYAAWLGIIDDALYDEIYNSDKFSNFVWRINWRIENQPKHKINDSRQYLKGKNEYYEDEYMIIKPFLEDQPSYLSKKHKEKSLNKVSAQKRQQQIKNFTGSSTHYLCISKQQQNVFLGKEQSNESDNKSTKNRKPATLIITYKSVEQISKILSRTDIVKGYNKDMGLLDFIQSHLKPDANTDSPPSIQLTHITHIISCPTLPLSQQFHLLFNTLDNLCYPSPNPATHLFYGYGLKSSTTNIHHLMNSYYKGVRFYSICSKMFKFLPNITLNHLNYWQRVFDGEFIDVCRLVGDSGGGKNGSWMEVYKPIHSVRVVGHEAQDNTQNPINGTNFYSVSASLLSHLKYPLFSTSTQYRFTSQLTSIYQKKVAFQRYVSSKTKKNSKGQFITKLKQLKQFDPKVIFLGTNSKSPNQLRNVSAILLELPHNNTQTLCILDCGSGTYEQMVNQYDPQILDQKLFNLKIVFMTHLHADHNLGIIDLIKKRNDLIKKKGLSLDDNKLFMILPFNTLGWFYGYCKTVENLNQGCQVLLTETLTGEKINLKDDFFESRKCQIQMQRVRLSPGKLFSGVKGNQKQNNYESSEYYQRYIQRFGSYEEYVKTLPDHQTSVLRDLISVHGERQDFIKELFDELIKKIKLAKFMPSKVFHCPFSYGIVIEHNNGTKVSYSGDCRPTPQFLQQAKNSNLLIHQATYETNTQQKAIRRLHSTTHEAIQACITSNSEHLCITHFTPGPFDRDIAECSHRQFYKPQVFEAYNKKTIIACDHLSFNLSEAEELVKVSKIISHLGRNSITEKNINPFSTKFSYLMNLKKQEEGKQTDMDQEGEYEEEDERHH